MLECETASRITIPALRMAVSRALSRKHGFGQERIGALLGVDQATISKYLRSGGSGALKRACMIIERKGLERKPVAIILKGAGRKEVEGMLERLGSESSLVRAVVGSPRVPAGSERK